MIERVAKRLSLPEDKILAVYRHYWQYNKRMLVEREESDSVQLYKLGKFTNRNNRYEYKED